MRSTNTVFLNMLSPAGFVRFDAQPAVANIFFTQSPDVIYVNVPANDAFVGNPTKDLLDRITELKAKYSTAWLPNSTSPTDRAFQNARDFVSTLPLTQIAKPAIHVASDGEVNFHWAGRDFHIDLGFYGDGNFSYYGAKEGCEPLFGDSVPVKSGPPKQLLDIASAA